METSSSDYTTPTTTDTYMNQSVLESVQSATIGSAAVKYDTSSRTLLEPPVPKVAAVLGNPNKPVSLLEAPDTRPLNLMMNNKPMEVCRDFIKGLCSRTDCRFTHDPAMRSATATGTPDTAGHHQQVCKDYRYGQCHRPNCKFLHLTKEQNEAYEETGILTPNVQKFGGSNERTTPTIQGKRPFSALLSGGMKMPSGTPKQVNEELKTKLIDMRKQVVGLTSLNDTLYTENQKYRNQLSGGNGGTKISLLPKPITTAGYMY